MASKQFLDSLRQHFEAGSAEGNEEGASILHRPEIAGLSVMLTAAIPDTKLEDFKVEDVSEECIRKGFEYFEWPSDYNTTWVDVVRLAQYCLAIDDEEEEVSEAEEAANLAALVNEIHEREI